MSDVYGGSGERHSTWILWYFQLLKKGGFYRFERVASNRSVAMGTEVLGLLRRRRGRLVSKRTTTTRLGYAQTTV